MGHDGKRVRIIRTGAMPIQAVVEAVTPWTDPYTGETTAYLAGLLTLAGAEAYCQAQGYTVESVAWRTAPT